MLKAIFGFLGLLIVLAIVGKLGQTQLAALGLTGRTATRAAGQGEEAKAVTNAVMGRAGGTGGAATIAVPGGMAGAAPGAIEGTVPYQAQTIQNNVREATKAALEKGVDRSNAAQP